jgi:hypothetical protein
MPLDSSYSICKRLEEPSLKKRALDPSQSNRGKRTRGAPVGTPSLRVIVIVMASVGWCGTASARSYKALSTTHRKGTCFGQTEAYFFISRHGKSSGEMRLVYPNKRAHRYCLQHSFKHWNWLELEGRKPSTTNLIGH